MLRPFEETILHLDPNSYPRTQWTQICAVLLRQWRAKGAGVILARLAVLLETLRESDQGSYKGLGVLGAKPRRGQQMRGVGGKTC